MRISDSRSLPILAAIVVSVLHAQPPPQSNPLFHLQPPSLFPPIVFPQLPPLSDARALNNANKTAAEENSPSSAFRPNASSSAAVGIGGVFHHAGSEPYAAIRVRFNEPFFEETARLFYQVFSYEVQNIVIQPQRQCFQEGCFRLHSFRITGFQRPRGISLKPQVPNLLLLNIFNFDVE